MEHIVHAFNSLNPSRLRILWQKVRGKTATAAEQAERLKLIDDIKELLKPFSGTEITYSLACKNPKKDNAICWYVGISKNLGKRLSDHFQGGRCASRCTQSWPPFELDWLWLGDVESEKTLEYVDKWGLDNVRGAEIAQPWEIKKRGLRKLRRRVETKKAALGESGSLSL